MRTQVLGVRIIPNADRALLEKLEVGDDVSYAALDEATKKANVSVAYARSMYAGSSNASTALSGEFIGILAAPDPAEVKSGIDAAVKFIENDAAFISANDDDSIVYFNCCISRTGSYLSKQAEVPEGTAMAYLIAAPMEAVCGIDAALKAADVEMKVFYGPPTETNFAGGLLVGDQAACKAACEAFAQEINSIADKSIDY